MKIEFSWDEHKADTNLKKHGVAFEDAALVFYDAHAVYKQDRFENGEYRWQAIGMIHGQAVLLVAHTVQDHNGMDHIRIISARQAEKSLLFYLKNKRQDSKPWLNAQIVK